MARELVDAIAAVRESIPMREAAEHYGLRFNRAGFAVCPFHNEKTPSFKIHNERGHCFGCGWHGDVIDFAERILGTDRDGALRALIRDFGLNIPLDRGLSIRERQQLYQQMARLQAGRKRQAEAEQKALDEYHAALDLFILYDQWKRDYAPKSPEEEPDPRYVQACRYLETARYNSTERG